MKLQASLKGRNANRLVISFLRLLPAPLFLFSRIRLLNTFGFLISFISNIVKASNKLTAKVHNSVYQLADPQALFIPFSKFPIKFFTVPLLIIFPSALVMFALLSPSVLAPTNVSLNYVYNGTDWVPWNATSDGKPRVDLNLLNITAGSGVFSSWANATYLNASQWVNATSLSIDGSTLFVDSANRRVGIGTTSPSSALTVAGGYTQTGTAANTFTGATTFSAASALTVRQDGGATDTYLTAYRAASGQNTLHGQFSRGSLASPTIVLDGDLLFNVVGEGMDGTAGTFRESASIQYQVDGTPGINDMPGRIVFLTTADGAGSPTARMRITSAGNVGIGTTAPVGLLNPVVASGSTIAFNVSNSGTGNTLWIGDADGDTTPFVIDNAGNVGIGTASPQGKLNVVGGNLNVTTGNITLNGTGSGIVFNDGSFTKGDVSARVFNSTSISLSNNVDTVINFDSERFDTDTIHSTTTNTGRLTANTAGKYIITGHLHFASNTAGRRYIYIRLNGATVIAINSQPPVSGGIDTQMTVTTLYSLAATDYVELLANQDSGGGLNLVTTDQGIEFSMIKVSG